MVKLEEHVRKGRTFGERVSEGIAKFAGSMGFIYIHILWFGGWIALNSLMRPFDPFPFTFLTLVVSLEAIFLSTFILISQNHEAKLTERRNHLDLQINLLAEQENTAMLELLRLIAEKIGIDCEDAVLNELLEEVHPKDLVEQIEKARERLRMPRNLEDLPCRRFLKAFATRSLASASNNAVLILVDFFHER